MFTQLRLTEPENLTPTIQQFEDIEINDNYITTTLTH